MRYVILLFVFLVGCASTPRPTPVHNTIGVDDAKLAVLTAKDIQVKFDFLGRNGATNNPEAKGLIAQVETIAGKKLFKEKKYNPGWSSVKLQEGVYVITTLCRVHTGVASPKKIFSVKAGKKYEFSCGLIYRKELFQKWPRKTYSIIKEIR